MIPLNILYSQSLKSTYVTANTLVQGQRVKGRQGHNVRNRQHGFTAKFVDLSYLFNLSGGRFHGHVAHNGCQAEVHKTSENNIFKPKKNTQNIWRDVVRPSRFNALAIARFLVDSASCRICIMQILVQIETHTQAVTMKIGFKRRRSSHFPPAHCLLVFPFLSTLFPFNFPSAVA